MEKVPKNVLLVGLGPRARVGKDHAYRIIERAGRRWYSLHRYGFGDILKSDLKETVARRFGLDIFTENDHEKELLRPLMVAYGGLVGRKVDPEIWINALFTEAAWGALEEHAKYAEAEGAPVLFAIPDVRYVNEVEAIQARGGVYLHIEAPSVGYRNDEERAYAPTLLPYADAVIHNDFTPAYDAAVIRGLRRAMIRRDIDAVNFSLTEY